MATEEIVIGQNIRLSIETNQTLTGASVMRFKWRNDQGQTGYVDCTIDDSDESKMYYDVEPSDFSMSGTYWFWAYVVFANGNIGIANNPLTIVIKSEGDL